MIRQFFETVWYDRQWYKKRPLYLLPMIVLLPASWLFCLLVEIRRSGYRTGLVKSRRAAVPVIVVGNITVGGTGKTPLIIALASWLQQQGYRPAVISRGYGRKSTEEISRVSVNSSAEEVGDEPLLIASTTGVPVYVGVDRVTVADRAVMDQSCDLILSDDGLQHYRMGRDIEIAVIDGERRLGSRLCLPAGPLRERASRLQQVDVVVVNGENMRLQPQPLYLLGEESGEKISLDNITGRTVHAVAGIGNPERFFTMLRSAGIEVITHPFPDHHQYNAEELNFADGHPVVTTEKDAVKMRELNLGQGIDIWVAPVTAELDEKITQKLKQRLSNL